MFVVRSYRAWNAILDADRQRLKEGKERLFENWQGHHGIPQRWSSEHIPGYEPLDDPVIAMPNSPNHNATRRVYNQWSNNLLRTRGWADGLKWEAISERDIMDLVQRMNVAADIPENIWDDYLALHDQYINSLKDD